MNDNTPQPGHEGRGIFGGDDFDPVIAQQFQVLDRVTAPEPVAMPLAVASNAGQGSQDQGPRSGFLMAVAACVGILVMGVAGLVALNQGGETGLVEGADETGQVPVVADESPDTTAALVVEGQAVRSTTRPESESGSANRADEADAGANNAERADGASDAGSNGSSGNVDGSNSGDSNSGENQGTATTIPGDDGDRTTVTFSTETTDLFITTVNKDKQPSETIWPQDPNAEATSTVSIRGLVTEVFTDCQSHLVLNEAGQVVDGGPVSCDGGSYVVVDGTKVFTSSGFTSADLAFDKHPRNMKPGLQVAVVATAIGGAGGPLGLACSTCQITPVG